MTSSASALAKRDQLIETLKTKFPRHFFRPSEDCDGADGGVWMSGEEGLIDYYGPDNTGSGYYVEPQLNKLIEDSGFFLEPHDPGTWFAWPV